MVKCSFFLVSVSQYNSHDVWCESISFHVYHSPVKFDHFGTSVFLLMKINLASARITPQQLNTNENRKKNTHTKGDKHKQYPLLFIVTPSNLDDNRNDLQSLFCSPNRWTPLCSYTGSMKVALHPNHPP